MRRDATRRPPPAAPAVHLEIAGLVFSVAGARPASVLWLRERYRPFLTRKRPTVSLRVDTVEGWPGGGPRRPRLAWHDGRIRVDLVACRAEGSLDRRRIRLSVPAAPAALGPSVFRILSAVFLLPEGGFLLHASGVVHRRRAWVFCGPSESGKTTIARLAGTRPVLSDETVAITKPGRTYRAVSTPFFGEGGPTMGQVNMDAPIRGVCFLHQAREFSHRRLTPREAVERAFPQVFLPKTQPAVVNHLLGCLAEFAAGVACYDLCFPARAELWEYLDAIG